MGLICKILTFLLFLMPTVSWAAVIFQDDFSLWTGADPYNQSANDYTPPDGLGVNGWSCSYGGASDTYDGVTHYGGEISTPGRNGVSDRSFKVWRHGIFHYNYISEFDYYEDAIFNAGKEIYTRWYMKIPSDFELAGGACDMNYLIG